MLDYPGGPDIIKGSWEMKVGHSGSVIQKEKDSSSAACFEDRRDPRAKGFGQPLAIGIIKKQTTGSEGTQPCQHLDFCWDPCQTSREGDGTPHQYSCLENPMDGGAWWAAVHGVTRSRTRLSNFTFIFHFHALEKEMATHSSVLAWRIPGTGQPGGLPSMGSHRIGHDWSDLAAVSDFWPLEL